MREDWRRAIRGRAHERRRNDALGEDGGAPRSRGRRRYGRARQPCAGRRLRRRRSPAIARGRKRRRRTRRRDFSTWRQRLRREGIIGDSGRRRHRSQRLSRRRLRLRHPVANAPSDAPAAQGARQYVADWTARDRVISKLRPLARAHPIADDRAHADHVQPFRIPGTTRRIFTFARSEISSNSSRTSAHASTAASRSTTRARRCA